MIRGSWVIMRGSGKRNTQIIFFWLIFLSFDHLTVRSGEGSSLTRSTCETNLVVLAGFSRFRPTYCLVIGYIGEVCYNFL